jgi:hypothetical protein
MRQLSKPLHVSLSHAAVYSLSKMEGLFKHTSCNCVPGACPREEIQPSLSHGVASNRRRAATANETLALPSL